MKLTNARALETPGWYDVTVTLADDDPWVTGTQYGPKANEAFDYTVDPNDTAPLAEAIRKMVEEQAIEIGPYVPPPPVVPASITARQGKIMLLRMGLMTADEAISGAVPAFLSATMKNMKPEEAAELSLTWRDAAVWYRNDPLFGGSLLQAASASLNMPATDEAVDQFFISASAI